MSENPNYLPLSYKSEISYIRNKVIEEYDMRRGGYSITLSEGLIEDEGVLNDLAMANKHDKQIILGLYAKNDKEYVKALNNGFRKYVTAFAKYNSLSQDNILSIKKDSLTFFNGKIIRTKFKQVLFTKRGEYTSMLRIGNLEFYINSKTKERLLKGITIDDYKETLIEEIFKVLELAELPDPKKLHFRLSEIRDAYIHKRLTDSYYRELSVHNAYLLRNSISGFTMYSKTPLQEGDAFFDETDITYNYRRVLMPLFEALL